MPPLASTTTWTDYSLGKAPTKTVINCRSMDISPSIQSVASAALIDVHVTSIETLLAKEPP